MKLLNIVIIVLFSILLSLISSKKMNTTTTIINTNTNRYNPINPKSELIQKINQIFDLNSTNNKNNKLIQDTKNVIFDINNTVFNNPAFTNMAWNKTAYIVDTHGPRLWGSPALEEAIDELKYMLENDGFTNVKKEEIKDVQVWTRGNEHLTLNSPRKYPTKIPMVGLGLSVGGDVTADVVVVKTFDELHKLSEVDVKDKIVFYNCIWNQTYGNTVQYRSRGAIEAAKLGATGVIIRSIAPVSLETPHTGRMLYEEGVTKIPACAISLEDADMLQRMADRGQTINLALHMEAAFDPVPSTSYNLVGELVGSEFPDEIILMGGHLDSWDVGPQTGSNDDLAGFMVCYEAVRVLIKLGYTPRRTIRLIGWSGEEMGQPNKGAFVYAETHKDELVKHVVAFESDEGTTDIWGWGFSGSAEAESLVNAIGSHLLSDYKMSTIVSNDGKMVDTTPLANLGVPVMRNRINHTIDNEEYFRVHHTAADSISILDKFGMNRNVIAIASMFYTIGNLPGALPREKQEKE